MTALAARPRFLGALLAWSFFVAASPGVLSPDGSALLAALGVGVWGMVELRPYPSHSPGASGRRGRPWVGFLAHTLGAMPGAAGLMIWVRHVYWPPLLWIGFGVAVYSALGGVVLRRLGRWLPLPLAVALAWTGSETLRTVVPNPFGLGWMRVGYNAHAHLWLSGSARFWGVGGLTFVLAAGGGLATALWTGRGRAGGLAQNPAWRAPVLVSALAPLAVGVFLALVIRPPATVDGPRLLLIQPGFAQVRKQSDPWEENFRALRQLTAEGLAKERAAGRPEPDLVCWGETMLYVLLFEEGVRALAVEERAEDETDVLARGDLRKMERWENEWVREWLFGLGRPGLERVIPAGTSFLSGAEIFV
ncbi:MAG: hypothetical protein O7B99_08405, partial [Planctomycetota bacterium]|nr:hypothetical protein [Planctomycetota bacterium]